MNAHTPPPSTLRQVSGSRGLVSLFARHPNAANLAMVLLIVFGLFACLRINTQFFPTINIPTVSTTVVWPGASAEDVETNILAVMEPELRFLDGVQKVVSTAREGSGSVTLEFETGTDMDQALRDVETAARGVSNLPEDAEEPTSRQFAFFDRVARLALAGPVPEEALRFYARKIRDDLIARGIDKVTFRGLRARELQVEIPERELRRLDMTVADVSRTVAANSRDLPSGQMEGSVERQLRAVARLDTAERLGGVEIKSFPTGEKVRLGDVAPVVSGYRDGEVQGFSGNRRAIEITVQRAETADTLETHAILNDYLDEVAGQLPPNISLTAYDIRADALVDRILLLVKNGLGGLAIVVAVLFVFLNARVAFWVSAGIPVALLATIGFMWMVGTTINMVSLFGLIMMLGIIVDDAIVVGEHTATRFEMGDGPYEAAENGAGRMVTPVTAAMITTAASFGPILVIGSTFGQIVSVLPVVVLAVIAASLIECFLILPGHLAHTLKPRQAPRWSFWRLFAVALAAVIVLVALSSEGASRWFTEINGGLGQTIGDYVPPLADGLPIQGALAAIADWRANSEPIAFLDADAAYLVQVSLFALLFGFLVESLLALKRRLFAGPVKQGMEGGSFRRAFDRGFDKFRRGPFDWLVRLSFRWRYVTVAVGVAGFIAGAVAPMAAGKVPFVFFPSVEAETINARVVFNAGTPEPQVVAALERIEEALSLAEARLQSENETGEKLIVASFVTLGSAGRSSGDNLAQFRVQLTASEARTVRTPAVTKAWREAIPKIAGVRRVSLYESRGGPPGRDIDLQLRGDRIGDLKALAVELTPIVEALPGVSGVSDDLPYGKPELVMSLTPRGSALGFTIEEVGRQLRNAFEGSVPRRFADGEDEVTIRISRSMPSTGTAALRNFELRSPSGEFAPLDQVVDIEERQGFAAIERVDGRATVSITADLDTEVTTTEQAIAALEAAGVPGIVARSGASYEFSGRAEERRRANNDLLLGCLIAACIIYVVLAWTFASYWRPFSIMLIIPFGVAGAIFGHWVTGYTLSMLSYVAMLGLSGILVNDSIVMVSRLDERLAEGDSLTEAAVGASRDRLRAVLLTSLTTVGGLIPLLFEKSLQAQFLIPMGVTIVFGLAAATFLVLFLVPAFVGIGDDVRRALGAIYGRRREPEFVPAE